MLKALNLAYHHHRLLSLLSLPINLLVTSFKLILYMYSVFEIGVPICLFKKEKSHQSYERPQM